MAMTEHQADVPDKYILGDSWGLGWIRFGWDGRRLIGHDGNTLGQAAFLRVLPDEGLAVTLLTNGGNTPRPVRGSLPRDLRRARRRRDAAAAPAARRAGVRRRHALSRHVRAREREARRAGAATGSRSCARSSPARSPRSCRRRARVPDDARSRTASSSSAAEDPDLGAGHVLRARDRRAVHALRRPRDAEGRAERSRRRRAPRRSASVSCPRPRCRRYGPRPNFSPPHDVTPSKPFPSRLEGRRCVSTCRFW